MAGTLRTGDRRYYTQVTRENLRIENAGERLRNDQEPLRLQEVPGFVGLYAFGFGPNQVLDPIGPMSDDPGVFHLLPLMRRCLFTARNARGGENGTVADIVGPWNPGCPVRENGVLRRNPNPFSTIDANPILMGPDRIPFSGDEPIDMMTSSRNNSDPTAIQPFGRGELPYRPAPWHAFTDRDLALDEAQGLYVPSAALVREIRSGDLDPIDQNFGQQELAWNRGASQQDEKELMEAYVDIEAFGGRLWLRLGKQTIVWGKTELFRNTDQFNPQDFALASIPDLESSRIALWAARGTWSFYNVGKLEDVRLELAVNFDDVQPADLGRCGEPFALELVCGLTLGYFAHGLSGVGLAGHDRPSPAWKDPSGLEGGARLEWRYKRFSFQLSDFWGYDDFPYPRRITTYERNVDPESGRPRRAGSRGSCRTGAEPACLGRPNAVRMGADGQPVRLVDTAGPDGRYDGIPDTPMERGDPSNFDWSTGSLIIDPAHKSDVLANHSANQSAFAIANILCGVANTADPALCGFAALNGHGGPGFAFGTTVAAGVSALMAGARLAITSASNGGFYCRVREVRNIAACRVAVGDALRLLNLDPGDDVGAFSDGGNTGFVFSQVSLGQRLSPEQEALFGCGPFYQSDCDVDGVDYLNAEASVLLQSWPGFDGTTGRVQTWDTRSPGQPGTLGFVGGPVATRFESGRLWILPGARGPDDPGYDPRVDGCVRPGVLGCNAGDGGRAADAVALTHPMSGELFRSELAAASWNWLVGVATGGREIENPALATFSEFDPFDPYGIGIRPAGAPNAGVPRAGIDV